MPQCVGIYSRTWARHLWRQAHWGELSSREVYQRAVQRWSGCRIQLPPAVPVLSPSSIFQLALFLHGQAKNINTNQKYSIAGNQPGLSLFVSPGAGVKVHLTSHIGLMASVSYDGYLANAFDSAKNNYHTTMVPNLGINFGLCFQIPGW